MTNLVLVRFANLIFSFKKTLSLFIVLVGRAIRSNRLTFKSIIVPPVIFSVIRVNNDHSGIGIIERQPSIQNVYYLEFFYLAN